MRLFRIPILLIIGTWFLLSSCDEKIDPEVEARQNREAIVNEAPIAIDYQINTPSEKLSEDIKAFSGHWVGRWRDRFPSQLIVTEINSNKATFIYSFGDNPSHNITAGAIQETIELDDQGRIVFQKDSAQITFTVNTILNKVIGVKIKDDEVSNIVMERMR